MIMNDNYHHAKAQRLADYLQPGNIRKPLRLFASFVKKILMIRLVSLINQNIALVFFVYTLIYPPLINRSTDSRY